MPISLDTINLRSYGPLRTDISLKLGRFNLIYGGNERGKTLIVEFLLRSLFESAGNWELRDVPLEGSISVSGLDAGETFSPRSRNRLDSMLLEQAPGLPRNIARLLVVKSAELAFIQGRKNGINRTILKEYLSGTKTLDTIENRISATLKSSQLNQAGIHGPKRGEIKRCDELQASLTSIDTILANLDAQYSGAKRARIREELDASEQMLQSLNQARRFEAFELSQQIDAQNEQLSRYPEEALLNLNNRLNDFHNLQQAVSETRKNVSALEGDVEHIQWLRSAVAQLESWPELKHGRPQPLLLPAACVALIASTVFLFLEIPLAVLASVFGAVFFTALYILRLQKSADSAVRQDQYLKILQEFSRRFPKNKSDLATMKAALEGLQASFYNHEQLSSTLAQYQQSLLQQQQQIETAFSRLEYPASLPEDWSNKLEELRSTRRSIEKKIHSLELELSTLNIKPDEYLPEDPGGTFTHSEWDTCKVKVETLEKEQLNAEMEFQSLKQQICAVTHDDISTPWEGVIQNLLFLRKETAQEYHGIVSDAAGKIILFETLNGLRVQEDEKIQQALQDRSILDPLWQVTGRYDSLELEEDHLYVSGPHARFRLSDLSSGAQEQVLLALRLGLASRLFAGQPAFFILDDAFQHADWQRREKLLQEIIRIAQSGWQITYFSMDEHIHELFTLLGKKAFKKDFRYFELADS